MGCSVASARRNKGILSVSDFGLLAQVFWLGVLLTSSISCPGWSCLGGGVADLWSVQVLFFLFSVSQSRQFERCPLWSGVRLRSWMKWHFINLSLFSGNTSFQVLGLQVLEQQWLLLRYKDAAPSHGAWGLKLDSGAPLPLRHVPGLSSLLYPPVPRDIFFSLLLLTPAFRISLS